MNLPTTPGGAATALAALLLSLPADADVPAYLTPVELAAMQAETASAAPEAAAAGAGVSRFLADSRQSSQDANEAVASFLKQAAITTISVESAAPVSAPEQAETSAGEIPPPAAPLHVAPGPDDTVIEAEDGMYFDAAKGVLVYLKNVHLTNPDFTLTGANELKVFLEKKDPPEAKKPEAPEDGAPAPEKPVPQKPVPVKSAPGLTGATSGFGSLDHIVATGAVKVVQKSDDPAEPPVEASAAVLNYNAKTGEIILNGGYPWVKKGDKYMRAKQPNLYIRIQKDGSFVTQPGQWDMGGKLSDPNAAGNSKKPKPGKPAPPAGTR